MIGRREFIALTGGMISWSIAARAQQGTRRRIGILMPYPDTDAEIQNHVRVLRQELERLGWIDGKNVQFDERWATFNLDRIRSDAASLMSSNPDVVIAIGGRVIPILLQISRTVPIVVPGAADPVGIGWVKSLARPGGNVTGFTILELSVLGKMIDILKQISPAIRRVALLYNPENPSGEVYRRTIIAASPPLGVEPVIVPVHDIADLEKGLANFSTGPRTGLLVPTDVTIAAYRDFVIEQAARLRLPAIYPQPVFVKSGGLVCYGAERTDLHRRAASYVDRILRGEQASDLPFQQPNKYQLIINLKAAKALGLEISAALLAASDEVIE